MYCGVVVLHVARYRGVEFCVVREGGDGDGGCMVLRSGSSNWM